MRSVALDGAYAGTMYEDLHSRIDDLFRRVAIEGYDAHRGEVLDIITACRRGLIADRELLGPWERDLLEYAETCVRANFLRLALHSTKKALEVIQLPAEEYEEGFNYGRRRG